MTGEWPEPRPEEAGRHQYLSTACHHEIEALAAGEVERAAELHAYCSARAGKAGAKRPAHCKWCDAPCTCPRHTPGAVPVAWSPAAGETERVLREQYAGVVDEGVMRQLRERLGLGQVVDGVVVSQADLERAPTMHQAVRDALLRAQWEGRHDRDGVIYAMPARELDAVEVLPRSVYPRGRLLGAEVEWTQWHIGNDEETP